MRVSLIGLGGVKLGRDQGVRYAESFTIPSAETAAGLLDRARELGVNLIDTAPAYGTSEILLGNLLKPQRRQWIICSKVGEEFQDGASHFDFSPGATRKSVERSLQRLATDYLDIALIHSNGADLRILNELGTLEALRELQQQGLIRAVGISHKTVEGGLRAIELGADVIMATLNPRALEQIPVVKAASAQGCGVLIKKALAGGDGSPEDLAWVAGNRGVSSIVVGTINRDHLQANIAAACAEA